MSRWKEWRKSMYHMPFMHSELVLTNQLIKTVFVSTAGNSSTAGKKKVTLHTFPTKLAIPLKFNFSVSTYQNSVIFLWEKTYLVIDFGDLIIISFSYKTFDFQCSPDQSPKNAKMKQKGCLKLSQINDIRT